MKTRNAPQKMVSLFAGIGGFELGFRSIGVKTSLMCEIDPIANKVLATRLPEIPIVSDVCSLKSLPDGTDILCAGFPCQDLSSVGVKKGMAGTRSSLVKEVFRLLKEQKVEWVVFENVSFMLSLNGGETVSLIVNELEKLGYSWAYRTIDSVSFLPQHRNRVFVVASLNHDPRDVLLSDSYSCSGHKVDFDRFSSAIGFYWTEGKHALGLVANGIPTLKAGSTIGIPSPPAIAFPDGEISMPDIRDAERLQGFPVNWTQPAEYIAKSSSRWRLVGNAVTVNVIEWIAKKMVCPQKYNCANDEKIIEGDRWPKAAWGLNGIHYVSAASLFPKVTRTRDLKSFLKYPRRPLSLKASLGFEKRLREGSMRCPVYLKQTLKNYIQSMEVDDAD